MQRVVDRQVDRALSEAPTPTMGIGDAPAARALLGDPALLAALQPVDAGPAAGGERVALGERVVVVRRIGYRHAGAHGVARAQQRAEVGLVGDPEGSDDQVAPAAVLPASAHAT